MPEDQSFQRGLGGLGPLCAAHARSAVKGGPGGARTTKKEEIKLHPHFKFVSLSVCWKVVPGGLS